MTDAELERQRQLLHEAFTAGWQAALAVKVTSPAVLAVIESCFELWLEEEIDERGVLGLPFRRRYDLPRPKRASFAKPRSELPEHSRPRARRKPQHAADAATVPVLGEPRPSALSDLPRQREHGDPERAVETTRTSS